MTVRPHSVSAILPCSDLDRSEAFYARLGFKRADGGGFPDYRIMSDGEGGDLHLRRAEDGWLIPGRNPFGVYVYAEEVDELAERVRDILIHPPQEQPWGMYEFAVSDPDQTLVRVGWPTRLRT